MRLRRRYGRAHVVTGNTSLRLKDGVGRRHGADREPHLLVAFEEGGQSWVPVADLHPS